MKLYTGTVTPAMQEWASNVLHDPHGYPMGSGVGRLFSGRSFFAHVEHHTWTVRNGVKVYGAFRGVTLYEATEPQEPEAPA